MAKQKRIDFLNAFMSVWEVHKSNEPSERLIDAYWSVLEKYEIDQINAAFSFALSSMQWFPKPVELINFIEQGPGDIEDIALVEADKVLNAIRDVSAYTSITFDNPVTMAVIDQGWGGWMKVCDMREDEEKWFRKDFVKIYKAYSNQGIKKYGHLIGYFEDANAERWPERVEPPVLIGDPDKALKVLEFKQEGVKRISSGLLKGV